MLGRVMAPKDGHHQTTHPQSRRIRREVFAGVTKLRTLRWSVRGVCVTTGPLRGRWEV